MPGTESKPPGASASADVYSLAPLPPVLLVHGIWDSRERLRPLQDGLIARGLGPILAPSLIPNDGRARIEELARQVATHVDEVLPDGGPIDVVGFSMGALVARTWIQLGGGRARVRRFVSISGPHHGTRTAFALPLTGVRQMRPGSDLLRALADDPAPWGDVEVHCLYTPFDVMVTPARTSVLPGARSSRAIPVLLHRWMITDARALDAIAEILSA